MPSPYPGTVKTVILEPVPSEVEALIQRRRALGQDRHDEVWEGEYHMTPAPGKAHAYVDHELAAVLHSYARRAGLFGSGTFNLGTETDYRVPDQGLHRARTEGVWESTAAMVVEIVSPADETFAKFDFYGRHGVDEILVADPAARTVRLWRRTLAGYEEATTSVLLDVAAAAIQTAIDWP